MTIRKSDPARGYETFTSNDSDAGTATSHTPSTADSQKTISAAAEATRLASQGSWGDNYLSGTPISNATPTASTVDETEERYGDSRYPSDPPPLYTPTDTTASSPTTLRQQPDSVRPSSPDPQASPSPSPGAESEASHNDDQVMPGAYTPSSPLLESAPTLHQHDSVHWSRDKCKSHRYRRCKKACWFTFALVLCLWLMLPVLLNAGDKARTRRPRPTNDPLNESPIPSWPKPSREYRQHETSRSIDGTFHLYDLLDLQTTSGSISITVNPQSGDKPAVLRLSSYSGSINVRMGDSSWNWGHHPHSVTTNRTFDTSISTKSGSVSGSILHGNGGKTDITTKSGMISMTVHTAGVGENDTTSTLSTSTVSGSQDVYVRTSDTVKVLQASHIVYGSGSLSVNYPTSWEGEVHAKSGGSGSVNIYGNGLEYQGGGREKWARRGKGDLKAVEVLGRGSGSVAFTC